ncbi:MAG: hypothetical protein KUG64_10285 [Cycloclasticus sp.]|nr:hypothetical protein [Cycloclasticus sp.]
MRIVITTLIWQRPEITKIWCEAVLRICEAFTDLHINVVVAGSEGASSRRLIESYFPNSNTYLETPNSPLSDKANLRLQECRKYKPDYVLFLGSDDIMNNKTFAFILDKMKRGHDEIAPMDLYIYDSISKRMIYSEGYTNHRKGERLAIGRVVKSSILDRMNWKMFQSGKDKGLDGGSRNVLTRFVQNPYYYYLKENDLMIVDVKSRIGLSKFMIRSNHKEIAPVKIEEIEEHKLIKKL